MKATFMARTTAAIIKDLEDFDPIESDWERADALIEELMASPAPATGAAALLGVFERWPGALTGGVGGGCLFSAIHALESLPGYEPHLLQSLRRKPSVLSVMLANRMLNAGEMSIGDVHLVPLLRELLVAPKTTRTVKEEIETVLEMHPENETRLRERRAKRKK